jgi:hypothetical protein
MTLDYTRTWEVMNELEMVTSKICSAREILDSAINALESGNKEKTETLMYAADEFLQYYLEDFDRKFKTAWSETVVKLNKDQYSYLANDILTQDRVSNFPGEQYTEEELNAMCDAAEKKNKVKKWILPVQEMENGDTMENEYFIQLPDDLLDQTGWKENDELNWVDNKDGTFTLTKTNG